jgi:hypothetical protein
MPHDGSITFGNLVGKLTSLRVVCDKCGRKGHYSVSRLIETRSRKGKLTDWLTKITADCPRKRGINMNDQCAACCPDLARVM